MVKFTPKMHVSWIQVPDPRLQSSQRASWPVPINNEGIKPATKSTCCQNIRDYLLNTTLHGLKYVGDGTITLIER